MVNGYCFGGAFSIVESCDIVIAAEEASFGLSEINFKGFPGGAVSKSLANLFRPRDALFYGLTGRRFDGKTAARIGFATLAVPLATLRDETMAVAREIAAKDPAALRATKEGYRFSLEMTWEASMNYTLAKEEELANRQRVGWKDSGVRDFVDGKFKPGLQSHETIKK
jgi:trans-feruloyl-CoA hydratase/vanillin synthase